MKEHFNKPHFLPMRRPKSILLNNNFRDNLKGGKRSLEDNDEPSHSRQKRTKFAGPIKIIVIEPSESYYKQVCCALGTGLSNLAVASVNTTVLIYSVTTRDLHAILCCLAYHFFTAQAILCLHYANGWSTPMRLRHRKITHIFLNIIGISFAILGTIMIMKRISYSNVHGFAGALAGYFAIVTGLIGFCKLLFKKSWILSLHVAFGIFTFIMSSICLCCGLYMPPFKKWAQDMIIVHLLTILVIFYTLFIITSSFLKCISRI